MLLFSLELLINCGVLLPQFPFFCLFLYLELPGIVEYNHAWSELAFRMRLPLSNAFRRGRVNQREPLELATRPVKIPTAGHTIFYGARAGCACVAPRALRPQPALTSSSPGHPEPRSAHEAAARRATAVWQLYVQSRMSCVRFPLVMLRDARGNDVWFS